MMIVVPHSHTYTSPRSRALAEQLRATIREFQHREPKLSREEIAAALRDAQPSGAEGGAERQRLRMLVTAGVLGLLAAVGAAVAVRGPGSSEASGSTLPLVVMAVVGVGIVAALVLRSRNND